ALRALPEEFAMGAGDDRAASESMTPEAMRAMIERAAAVEVPIWIGWSVPRETALEHAAIMDEQLEDAIVALAPIYRLAVWAKDNDHIALDRRLEDAEPERAKTHADTLARTEKWRAEHEA